MYVDEYTSSLGWRLAVLCGHDQRVFDDRSWLSQWLAMTDATGKTHLAVSRSLPTQHLK